MTEHSSAPPPVGTVAEEAARLIDAFAAWSASPTDGPGRRDGEDRRYAGPEESAGTGSEGEGPAGGHRCASCGAETGVGRAVTCEVCPVCQGIALLRSVRPETLDRLADLAAAVTATLRDVAAQGARGPGRGPQDAAGARAGRGGATVQDIPVEDGDHAREEFGQ
jgi:hypothetical protein